MRMMLMLIRRENGQAMAEYGPLLVFVGVSAAIMLGLFGGKVKLIYDNIVASF